MGEVGEKHGEKRNKRRKGVPDQGRETILCEFAVSTGTFPQRSIRWLYVLTILRMMMAMTTTEDSMVK